MKSKEEIATQWADAHESPRNDEMDVHDAILGALTEYATQQITAITAERDEYRKALEEIANIPVNGLPHTPIARHALAKYPQQ